MASTPAPRQAGICGLNGDKGRNMDPGFPVPFAATVAMEWTPELTPSRGYAREPQHTPRGYICQPTECLRNSGLCTNPAAYLSALNRVTDGAATGYQFHLAESPALTKRPVRGS